MTVVRWTLRALAAVSLLACSTSGATDGGVVDVGFDAPQKSACVAAGNGYACAASCQGGTVNIQDLPCGSGLLCCGPVGEGGYDGSDDANVFVDSPVFETGPVDAGHDAAQRDAGRDATTHEDAGGGDAARDTSRPMDAERDARATDAETDAHAADAAGDAKHG